MMLAFFLAYVIDRISPKELIFQWSEVIPNKLSINKLIITSRMSFEIE
jgi:hypothetical protein